MSAPSDERHLAIRVILLPKDTNAHGTIFGGVILSQIDLAGAVEARRHTDHSVVTVAMNGVEFHRPVYVGDVVSFYTRLIHRGRTSIRIKVEVEAQRSTRAQEIVQVTEAEVVYVAVDGGGKSAPL
ncbi:MAG: acyl-CoA thioesterase [Myxococcota bacterium]